MKTSRNLLLSAVLAGGAAQATEVYRWTDENGVVHFSQTAPPPAQQGASRVELRDDRPSDYDPDADIYGVEEQAARMQALREEREERRQAQREREMAQQRLQPQPQPRQYERWGYPVYWNPGNRPQPPLRPMPPIERPPPGPGEPIRPPRPITPRP